jgi:hypothetical protein
MRKRNFYGVWLVMEKMVLLSLILCSLVFPGCSIKTSGPSQNNYEKRSAKKDGIKALAVFVELAKPPESSQELSRHQLQVDVETKIRQAGVNVVSYQPMKARLEMPLIYVNVKIAKIDDMYAYNIDILCMAASRGPAVQSKLANCNLGTSGLVSELAQVRGKVADLVKLFIKDYLSAQGGNPAASWLCSGPGQAPLRLTVPPA